MKNLNIFNIKKIRYELIYKTIIWQLSYKRINKNHKKEKSEIKKSTKKIYKQKGTGRARHGSLKANIFRGGGITFGPNKYKNYYKKINKKIKIKSLIQSLSLKYKKNLIFLYQNIETNFLKYKILKKIYGDIFNANIKILIITEKKNNNLIKLIKNHHFINTIKITSINTLDIIKNEIICFTKQSLKKLLIKIC